MQINTFARLTAPGLSAIALVKCFCSAEKFTALEKSLLRGKKCEKNKLILVPIGENAIFDEPLLLVQDKDKDCVQVSFYIHGGELILRNLSEALLGLGLVESGQAFYFTGFTEYFESVLSQCPSPKAVEYVAGGLLDDGALSRLIENQFTDKSLLKDAEDNLSFGEKLMNPPRLVILGQSNTGKSTLLNELLGKERALVSGTAGATRDAVGERVFIDGFAIDVLDTAGLRVTKDELEIKSQAIAIKNVERADAVLFLSAVGEAPQQHDLFQKLLEDKPVLSVLNKIDMEKEQSFQVLQGSLEQKIKISLLEKRGLEQLRQSIIFFLFGEKIPDLDAPIPPGRSLWEQIKLAIPLENT